MASKWSGPLALLGTMAAMVVTLVFLGMKAAQESGQVWIGIIVAIKVATVLQAYHLWQQHRLLRQHETAGFRMLDDLSDFAVVLSEDGRVVHVSDKIRRFGRDPSLWMGKHWEEITEADNLSDVRKGVQEITDTGNLGPVYLQFLSDTPSPRLLEMTGVSANFGPRTLVVGLFRDVTDRREMERALARMDRLAAVAHLSAGVAHNFNNIFAGIVLNAELAAAKAEPAVAALTERIVAGAEQGSTLCHKLLTVARGEPPALRQVELGGVITDLVSLFQPEARRYGVEVSTHLPEPLTVMADANQVRQILLHLLFNAREAVGSQGWIRIQTSHTAAAVCIHVTNSGSPIPPEVLPLIFLPFFSTKQDEVKGTGLGLALCQSLAEGMGGRIDVVSTAEEPTTFTFVLPRRDHSDGEAA